MGQICCCDSSENVQSTTFIVRKDHQKNSLQHNLVREQYRDFHDVYDVVGLIGEGSISNIYKIMKKESNVKRRPASSLLGKVPLVKLEKRRSSTRQVYYALKEIDTASIRHGYADELRNEVELLKDLDHPNIVKAYESFYFNKKLSIVIELCTGGDLYARHPYSEIQAAMIVKQILSAVNYMHKRHVIHRDLKFENCMFCTPDRDNWTVKIIDFGLSRVYEKRMMTAQVGTMYTMSAEMVEGVGYSSKADLWSIGVITYMLLSGTKPFWGRTRDRVKKQIMTADYDFDAEVWNDRTEEGKEFISSLLQVNPQKRLDAEQALNHPWLSSKTRLSHRVPDLQAMKCTQARLVQYAESGEFRKIVMNVIAKKATTEEILSLREIFDDFDMDRDGTITFGEFRKALAQSNFSEKTIHSIFNKLDVNRNHVIMYTEFVASLLEIRARLDEARIADAFDQLSDGTGYISAQNLKNVLGKTGSKAYVNRLLAEADLDKDGRIGYDEFREYLSEKHVENIRQTLEISQPNDESNENKSGGPLFTVPEIANRPDEMPA